MEDSALHSFWGEYEHSVDDKGRVVLPQEYRGPLGDEFVLTRGPDQAILVLPREVWERVEARLRDIDFQRQASQLQRLFAGRAFVKLDPQYRLAIPKHLREWAGITTTTTAVIAGQGPKLEIWSKPIWDAYLTRFNSETMYQNAEAVGLAKALSG